MRWYAVAALVAGLLSLGACEEIVGGGDEEELSFDFESIAEPGFIDQTLTIDNHGSQPLTATFTLTPLDADGEEVPDVEASTAYGSDGGRLVLLPGENLDVVVLTGSRVTEVEDVEVAQVSTETVGFPAIDAPVTADPWQYYDETLTLKNPNDDPVSVAVSLLVYDVPAEGEPQQVVRVVPLLPSTTVEPEDDYQSFELTAQAVRALERFTFDRPTSIKVYFTPAA